MSIFVDEDGGCMMGTLLPPPPGFVPPTIAKSLQDEFGEEVYFYDLVKVFFWILPLPNLRIFV